MSVLDVTPLHLSEEPLQRMLQAQARRLQELEAMKAARPVDKREKRGKIRARIARAIERDASLDRLADCKIKGTKDQIKAARNVIRAETIRIERATQGERCDARWTRGSLNQ